MSEVNSVSRYKNAVCLSTFTSHYCLSNTSTEQPVFESDFNQFTIKSLTYSPSLKRNQDKCIFHSSAFLKNIKQFFLKCRGYWVTAWGERGPGYIRNVDLLCTYGGQSGSVGRASDWRFYDISDRSLNPTSTRKMCDLFRVKTVGLTRGQCAQPPRA